MLVAQEQLYILEIIQMLHLVFKYKFKNQDQVFIIDIVTWFKVRLLFQLVKVLILQQKLVLWETQEIQQEHTFTWKLQQHNLGIVTHF